MAEQMTKPISELRLWDKNPRTISKEKMELLKKYIKKYGMLSPLKITPDGEVLGGNHRFKALIELGEKEAWVHVVNPADEKEKLEIALLDNQEFAKWVQEDLRRLVLEIPEFTLTDFNISLSQRKLIDLVDPSEDGSYTKNVESPIYEPKGEKPPIKELFDETKTQELLEKISKSSLDAETKSFLVMAAYRHTIFNYEKIADFYAHSDKEVQELMEDSALVIIDFKKAIEQGYVKLSQEITGSYLEDKDEE